MLCPSSHCNNNKTISDWERGEQLYITLPQQTGLTSAKIIPFTCFWEQWCALLLALTRAAQFRRLLSSFMAFHKNSLKIHHVQDLLLLTTSCTACKVSSDCYSIFSLFPSLIWIKAPSYTAALMLTSQPTQKSLVYSRDQTFLIYLIIFPEQRLISFSLLKYSIPYIRRALCLQCRSTATLTNLKKMGTLSVFNQKFYIALHILCLIIWL